jgi:hypothetical protein
MKKLIQILIVCLVGTIFAGCGDNSEAISLCEKYKLTRIENAKETSKFAQQFDVKRARLLLEGPSKIDCTRIPTHRKSAEEIEGWFQGNEQLYSSGMEVSYE